MTVSNASKAYETLKNRILTGSFHPGEMLTESQLVDSLKMSRTPIRQALQMLAKDNLIKMVPHRGVFVNQMSLKEIQELFEVRYAIEKYAIERFINKGVSQADIQFLYELIHKQKEQKNSIHFMNIDHQFHLYFIQGIENKLMESMMENVRDQILLVGVKALSVSNAHHETLEEHQQIVRSIEQQDVEAAIEKVRQHISNSRKRILLI